MCVHVDAAALADRPADGDDLLGRRMQGGRIEGAGRHADGAGVERFGDELLHRRDLVRLGRAVERAHGAYAQRRVADQGGDVQRRRRALELGEVGGEARKAGPRGGIEEVERRGQRRLGHQGRDADAAVAGDHRGHALRDLEAHVGLRQQRLVVVRVRVDEAGRHDASAGLDRLACRVAGEIADRGDAAADDADIGVEAGRARAVDDGAAADEEVEGRVRVGHDGIRCGGGRMKSGIETSGSGRRRDVRRPRAAA